MTSGYCNYTLELMYLWAVHSIFTRKKVIRAIHIGLLSAVLPQYKEKKFQP